MKMLSVLAMTAALVTTGASAQGVYDRGGVRQQDSATSDRSDFRHSTKAKERSRGPRGSGSFASARDERSPSARAGSSAFDGGLERAHPDPRGRMRAQLPLRCAESKMARSSMGESEPVDLQGRVARNGAVRVSVAGWWSRGPWRRPPVANLRRRHVAVPGIGRTCAGTWVAERRA